jgi:predicted ABC-type ATPase
MMREDRSFAVEDLVVDTELLERARDAGYATKVIFISTEDPNLNVGRILIRMILGRQSVPLGTIPESYVQTTNRLSSGRYFCAARHLSTLITCSLDAKHGDGLGFGEHSQSPSLV